MSQRLLLLAPLALAAAATAAACSSTSSTPPRPRAPAAQTWKVTAGTSASNQAVQGLEFYPATLTIDAGDTVTWTFPTAEIHTVTFLGAGQATPPPPTDPSASAPAGGSTEDGSVYTSSGFVAGGATYSLTFPKPGTYKYWCNVHVPEMAGTIVVQPAGTAYPNTQAAYDAQAASMESSDISAGTASVSLFPYPIGGLHLAAGISGGTLTGPPVTSTVLRFLDANTLSDQPVNIPVGTTVTWTNLANNEPHDVVFPPAGATPPPTLSPFSPPSGGTTYDGTTLVNSGVMPPGASFSLTFMKAGTFTYYCLFHDDDGMVSTITVH
ncbi:MAG TPA: plastocyanin/azurin family copper-binding protein [Candidatus Baltobacteraceae bacterium]|nr:plastocyanin/azurin family copper-binding protein [Candidatus Baltobacteraceae bacterium]